MYAASRDVIGGAFGGLLAAWTLSDMHEFAVTISGVAIVLALATLYWIFQRMVSQKDKNEAEQDQEEQNHSQYCWPPHRAS